MDSLSLFAAPDPAKKNCDVTFKLFKKYQQWAYCFHFLIDYFFLHCNKITIIKNFLAYVLSVFPSLFSSWIRINIQNEDPEGKINADSCGSGSTAMIFFKWVKKLFMLIFFTEHVCWRRWQLQLVGVHPHKSCSQRWPFFKFVFPFFNFSRLSIIGPFPFLCMKSFLLLMV